jgi:hypothetical protein
LRHAREALGRIALALFAAIGLIGGTLAGGAVYGTTHPAYARIAWLDRDPTSSLTSPIVRRALFADGRFLALAADGYRAGILEPALTSEIFATASNAAPDWRPEYRTAAPLGELIDLQFDGSNPRTVRIANPTTNLGIPPALARVLLLLAAADRQIATVSFSATALRFWATRANNTDGAPIDSLPAGFPLPAAASAAGVVIGGSDLALVTSVWRDVDQRLLPGLAHRFVQVDGVLWRVAWTLDLDGVGQLSAPGPAAATP